MTEFHDPELRQQLGRLSGPYPDDNVAFEQWQRRVGQARRRRAVAWTTAAAMTLIIGTVAVAALQSPTRHSLVPGKSAETSSEFTVRVASTAAEDSSTVASTVPETTASTTLAPDTTPSSEVEAESSQPEPAGAATAGAQSNGGSTKTTMGQASSSTSAVTPPPPATRSFGSGGGSITVRQDSDHLTVVGVSPAAGFEATENDPSGRNVEVTFKSGDHKFELTVKLIDGVMLPSTSESNDAPHQDSAPTDTSDGDHRGGQDSPGSVP